MAALVTITAPVSTGERSYALGGKPVALIVWGTGQPAAALTEDYRFLIGMADADRQVCRSTALQDNSSTPHGCQVESTNRLYQMASVVSGGAATVLQEAELVAFTDDGFTLDWHVVDGVASRIHVLAILEGEVDGCALLSVLCDENPEVIGALAFEPSAILTLGGTTNNLTGYAAGPFAAMVSLGVSDGTVNRTAEVYARLTGSTAAASTYHADASAVIRLISSIFEGATAVGCVVGTPTPTGFSVGKGGFGSNSLYHHFLCLGGVDVKVGTVTQPASNGDETDLALDFDPSLLLLQSVGDLPSAGSTSGARMAMGAWLADGTIRSAFAGAVNPGTTRTCRALSTSAALTLRTPAAAAADSTLLASVSVVDDGHALQWDTSDGTGRSLFYLALGLLVPPPPPSCTGGTVPTPDTPSSGEDLSGLRRSFHPWLELDAEAGLEGHAKDVPLNHHPDYHGGRKSPRVESWGEITQQLARPGQGYQSSGCAVELREADHFWRAREGAGEEFFNREGRIQLASDEVGRAQGTPHVVMRGALVSFPPRPGLRRSAQFVDILARDFREFGEEEPLLRERWKDLFPDAPEAIRDLKVPRYYGRRSGGLSDGPAPIPAGDPARGAVFDPVEGARVFGFDNLTAGPAAPINLTVTEENGGTIGLTHTPYDQLGFCAWCVDASGNEGDPYPFYASVLKTITGNGKRYRGVVTLPGGPLPHRVRVSIAGIYFREVWSHYIEIDPAVTTEVVFTHTDRWTGEGFDTSSEMSAGGVRARPHYVYEYALLFRYPDGVSARSLVCLGPRSSAYRRPMRGTAVIPPGAEPLELIMLRRTTGGEFRRMLVGPVTNVDEAGRVVLVDDFLTALQDTPETYLRPRGALPAYDSGQTESIPGYGDGWVPFGIHGAPSHAVLKIYAGTTLLAAGRYGVDVMAPGPVGSAALAHWDAAFGTRYRPYGGLETTTIYLNGALVTNHRENPDTGRITVDACTIEHLGNGRGNTIRTLARQAFHALDNYGLHRSKPAEAWNDPAAFSDGVSKLAGFVEVLEALEARQLGGPIDGTLTLEGDVTLRELDRLLGEHGLWRGPDADGRYTCIRIDTEPDLSTSHHYEHVRSVFGPIDISDGPPTADLCNVLPSSGAYDVVDGVFTVIDDPYQDDESIARYQVRMPRPTREFKFIADAAPRRDIVAREVLLFKHPPRWVGWWANYEGRMPHSDVGRVVLLTDVEGIGTTGYERQPIVILKRKPGLQRGLVYLWGLDLGRVSSKVARLTAPDQVAYTDATTAQKNRYLFLSDAAGLMSDGTRAPRLR